MKDKREIQNKKSTILIVDDEPVNITLLNEILSKLEHKILVANNADKALKLVRQELPDLVLLDIYMPGMSGIEACRQIRSDPSLTHIPVLFLTSSSTDIEEAFLSGGVDYILKPFKDHELIARVNTHLKLANLRASLELANRELAQMNASLEDKVKLRTKDLVASNASLRKEINERRHLQDRVEYLSKYDFVTRMFNRASMEEFLDKHLLEITAQNQEQFRSFLLYLDIDQFKVINDTCGHIAGDELLRELAELIKASLENIDILARMGGDEFAIKFNQTENQPADRKAQKLKKIIEDFHFDWEGETFQVGVSMGLVEIDDGFDGVDHLVSIAERTCYESKMKGGGEISTFKLTKVKIERSKQQMRWIPRIQQAIANNDFFLCGQYINRVGSAQQNKIEVLIRLDTPENHFLPPGHFIPVAEKYHMISFIDKWVLENVLKQKQLIQMGYQFSINLSGESINKDSFVDFVEQAISEADISGRQICFEITETSAISNIASTLHFMERIAKLGCEFSLDDFGTGTSSYEYLKKLPIQYLKIDGIFVRNLENEKINRMMVDSITQISKEMGIKVIAECVENEASFQCVKAMGVDYVQGFHFHKPTPLIELLKTV